MEDGRNAVTVTVWAQMFSVICQPDDGSLMFYNQRRADVFDTLMPVLLSGGQIPGLIT